MSMPIIPQQWIDKIGSQFSESYMSSLRKFLKQEYDSHLVYPPKDLIFRSLQLVDYNKVKVVILGQDPYHGAGQANGLAFAVHDTFSPKPPSLRRILDEVERNMNKKIDRNLSSLEGWAKQGVLLLNTTLTVRSATPLSHAKQGWEQFTDSIISALNEREDPVIFLLWGRHAQAKMALIESPHIVLTASHPSPLARGFEGCEHFTKANEILTSLSKETIDWCNIT